MVLRSLIVVVLVAVAGVYARSLAGGRPTGQALPSLDRVPTQLGTWASTEQSITNNVARVLAADATLSRRYRNRDGSEAGLFLAYFAEQQVNSQIHSPRLCVPGSGWQVVAVERTLLQLPDGQQPAMQMILQRDGVRHEMLYWFRTRRGSLTNEYALKWDLLHSALARKPTNAIFVRFDAPATDGKALRDLVQEMDAPLNALFGEAGLR